MDSRLIKMPWIFWDFEIIQLRKHFFLISANCCLRLFGRHYLDVREKKNTRLFALLTN